MRVIPYVGAMLLIGAAFGAVLHAQSPASRPGNASTITDQPRVYHTTGSRIAVGRNITVPADEEVNDAVVVVGGSVRVDGRVHRGLVVVGGNIDLGPQSEVRGDVVVVGGRVIREPGARLFGRVSDVSIGEWRSWHIGRISIPALDLGDFGRWMSFAGAIFRISFLAVLMAVLLVVARAPVARIGRTAAAAPGRAFMMGFAAELLFIPALIVATIALVVTIIGIPLVFVLIPVAIFGGFLAMALGFTALATEIGGWVQDRMGWRGHSAIVAAALGLLVVAGPTLAVRVMGLTPGIGPGGFLLLLTGGIVEFVVWTIGLGATLMTGFGRWSTVPPPIPSAPPVAAVA